jgi:uncharacterized protein (DUF608 family)
MKPANPSTSDLNRRSLLKLSASASLGWAFSRMPAMAGPFSREDFDKLVPADKKLSPEWVKALFAKGAPEVLTGPDLEYVGMPVGGIGAGQLYLGGDGKLWCWDVFNRHVSTGEEHYAKPVTPFQPIAQGFSLKIGDVVHPLDGTGFSEVRFRGEYPIGIVEYADPKVPLAVKLEAYSPFIPLNTDDSSLPATILEFTIHNPTEKPVEADLIGYMENGVCRYNRSREGILRQRTLPAPGHVCVVFSADAPRDVEEASLRPDVVFEDWDNWGYGDWKKEGAAFGVKPLKRNELPSYQGDVGGDAAFVVNSHAAAPGESINERDNATGKLTSPEFTIDRHFITFWIGGGRLREGSATGLHLLVDGKPVRSAAGQDMNAMALQHFDVREFAGKMARLEVIDDAKGGWGHIGLGKITFSDRKPDVGTLDEVSDFGTMALALLGTADEASADGTVPFSGTQTGRLGRALRLAPGESTKVTFIVAWHFPNLTMGGPMKKYGKLGRHYASRFASAEAVAGYIAANHSQLAAQTKLWRDTWYDSTLPWWFLDRTMLNTSILATSTCYRFADGRFYGWEGVGCCAGTCGHVYHYAHAMGRLFPDLERDMRERVDLGLALQPDGAIHFRGECNDIPAIDAQAGTILRALREHQMSADDSFLKRNWPKIKLATQWLIGKDADGDGLIEDNQHNTLDSDWFGKVAWLSGLYQAALVAAARMADVVGDAGFAGQCRAIAGPGAEKLVAELFDDGYFINKVDPKRPESINSGTGCHIDQVFGQSWAFQVGLPRVMPEKETVSALKSLWRYNFTPDAGHYRKSYESGRWYAMAGEAGLLMCTFPRNDWDFAQAKGKGNTTFAGYFNECMNGFEYQVAGHMIWEGMVMEGLAITRAVHDRYHASKRNPWNEVECGDHYARSMASYGVYLAACGFEYDGPEGRIGFAPKLTPEDFKCAFTAAEGWGTFRQTLRDGQMVASLSLRRGKLQLKSFVPGLANGLKPTQVRATLDGRPVESDLVLGGLTAEVRIPGGVTLAEGQSLVVELTS